jgi:alkanesulfonate monooxygenase SsuD/methylene tetrahydromethanopterin reductase-like flavin-dependent oxidoreductase (luciferase family)
VEAVQAVEAAGFDRVWVADHLSAGMFGGTGMLECFTQLTDLVAATTTIGLGTLVVNVFNRPAGLLAVASASVQQLSGGRLWLGLGAGSSPGSPFATEQLAIGRPPLARMADRHAAVVATLAELDRLWGPESPDGFLAPEPPPPTLLGVNSLGLARIAGQRTDGVNLRWSHPKRLEILAAARGARDGAGRTGRWTTSVWAPWDPDLARPDHPLQVELAAEGVDRLVLMWMEPPTLADIARAGHQLL